MLSDDSAKWGALPGDSGTSFRVWAPKRTQLDVVVQRGDEQLVFPLQQQGDGVFSGVHPVPVGSRYRLRLDGGDAFPDPCSRSQPGGPHEASEVIDPRAYRWTDQAWRGITQAPVVYELHVGTFTPEGTFAAAELRLPHLRELGVTVLELMPLNGFPGRFNWGYDGVNLWAPNATYGRPDELRHFIDAAHAHGLGVIVDVVYNHFGPDGNYLPQFADTWFNDAHPADWGAAVNFEGPGCEGVRRFIFENAAMWIREYHADGLRLDAVQNLFDSSPRHIVADITRHARDAAGGRALWLVGEAEHQDAFLVRPEAEGGGGLDAIWVDDFHHSAHVAAVGQAEAYMQDYEGSARELVSLALRNSLYAGQFYDWQQAPRGTALRTVDPRHVVFFLENHDQVAAGLRGDRTHRLAGKAAVRALTTFNLLLPQTPMLFMGQEFFARAPFLFFTDHHAELQAIVRKGRAGFVSEFASLEQAQHDGFQLTSPEEAFEASKLDWQTLDEQRGVFELHRELLTLRRVHRLIQQPARGEFDAAVLGAHELVLRWGDELLLLLSLGPDRDLIPCSEPLLAPPRGSRWQRVLSSEEARFGGRGAIGRRGRQPDPRWRFLTGEGPWRIQGRCATLLEAVKS